MDKKSIGIDATRIPLTVHIGHLIEPGKWSSDRLDLPSPATDFQPACSSIVISEPEKWEATAQHLGRNSLARLPARELQKLKTILGSRASEIGRIAVAHPALLPAVATDQLVKQITKEIPTGLQKVPVVPIAAPLAITLSDLATRPRSSHPQALVTCTPGLGSPVTANVPWIAHEWVRFRCEPGEHGAGYRLTPDWYNSEIEGVEGAPVLDARDRGTSAEAVQNSGRFLGVSEAALARCQQWREMASMRLQASNFDRIDPEGVAIGAAIFAALYDPQSMTLPGWELVRPIPLPVGVLCSIATEHPALMWREFVTAASDELDWRLVVNSSQVFVAALHGAAAADRPAPRWLAIDRTLPPERIPWTYGGFVTPPSGVGINRAAHVVEIRQDGPAAWSSLRLTVSPGNRSTRLQRSGEDVVPGSVINSQPS